MGALTGVTGDVAWVEGAEESTAGALGVAVSERDSAAGSGVASEWHPLATRVQPARTTKQQIFRICQLTKFVASV
jgi:hypothetical protein